MSLLDSVLANTQANAQANAQVIDRAAFPIVERVQEPASAINEKVYRDYANQKQELFLVESAPIKSTYGIIPNKKALNVNQECVNIVSDKYEIHQPNEILAQFQNVEREHGLTINKVLTNPSKGALLISAKYIDVKVTGEKHDVNVVFYTSHCGRYRTVLSCDLLRVACMNQIPTVMKNKQRHIFAEKHFANALNIDVIGNSLQQVPSMVQEYNRKAHILRDTNMTQESFIEFWVEYYKQDTKAKQFDSKVAKARELYNFATGQRELENSAYKAYNAITYMNTHEAKETKHALETVNHTNMQDSAKVLEYLVEYCEA